MRKTIAIAGVVAALTIAGCTDSSKDEPKAPSSKAAGAATPVEPELLVEQSALGAILTDQSGRTLYAFTPDKNGPGSCMEDCAATWPPFISQKKPKAGAGIDASLLTTVPRDGGVTQIKYGDWPLYSYVADVGPGDVDGQGEEDGLWWAVGPDGKLVKTAAA